jgi:hypothetical protein
MRLLANFLYRRSQAALDRHTIDLIDCGGPSIIQALGVREKPADGLPVLSQLYVREYAKCGNCGVLCKGAHECPKIEPVLVPAVLPMRRRG